MYIDKLDQLKCTIKMKPADVNSNTYIDFGIENTNKDSKYIKNTVSWTYVMSDLNNKEIVGTFCEEELQKPNQTEFRVEK